MTLKPGIEQFNLDVTELEAHAPSLQPWRSKRTGAGGTRQDQLPPLILEVYVSGNVSDSVGNDERVMVERWVLRHDTDPGGAEGGAEEGADTAVHRSPNKPRRTKAETTAVAYKRTVVMVRTLHALCRSLPANRFHRAARQSQNRGLRFAVEHEVREGRLREALEGEGPCEDDLTQKPTGNRGTFREHSFTPVRTPAGGTLRATVYFLDADALQGMDCVPRPIAPKVIDGYLSERNVAESGAGASVEKSKSNLTRRASAGHAAITTGADHTYDAPAPRRRDFGFGTGANANVGSTGTPDDKTGARPFRQNSWAGKATYGFGASPPTRTVSGGAAFASLEGSHEGSTGMGIPQQNSRGMLSEAFAEAGGDGDPRSEGARPDSDRPGSTRSGSSSRPPPSPLNQGQTATTTYGSAPTTPPGSYGQTTYGFGLGSLGHNRQTTNGPGSLPVGSPSLPFVSSHVSSAGFGGSGGGAYGFSTSLASRDHALARRAREQYGSSPGSRPQSATHRGHMPSNGTSPVYGSNDSPPWHFRGLTGALSASPGSTPGSTRTDPRGSHGGGGGGMNVGGQAVSNNPWSPGRGASNRRPSWSSPSSSLSVSMHEGAHHRGGSTHGGGMGAAIGSAVGTPFGTPSLGRQSGGGGYPPERYSSSYGASPGSGVGASSSFANAMAHLRSQRALTEGRERQGTQPGEGPGSRAIDASDASVRAGEFERNNAMFESGDVDPLPFVLDDDDSAFGPISSAAPSVSTDSPRGGSSDGGAVGGHHPQSLHRDGHRRGQRDGSFGLGSGRSDAAVGALVRMLQDAAPLHEGGGVGNKGSAASTDGGGAKGGSQGDDSLASSNVRSSDSGGSTTLDGGVGGGDVMTLDWALGQLSGFRDFKESLDESTSTLEAVVEKPNGEEGTEQG